MMKRKLKYSLTPKIFIAIFILLTSINVCIGQTKSEQIEELLGRYTKYGQFNGVALIAQEGEIVYKDGFGLANMEWKIPNRSETKHRLGSITKQFTAVMILQLVEQGKVKLNVPISTYLPDYPGSRGDIITIHHLLTHTSGTPNYTSFRAVFEGVSRDPYTPERFTTFFSDSTLLFNPGERFAYSNSGYFLLGVIIEKVTGKSYEQVLKDNITIPLKMNNTGYDHHGTILPNRAAGYVKNGSSYRNAPYLDMSIPYAAGSLYSTVEDLYLWDQALYSNQLLSEEKKKLIFAKHIRSGAQHYGYGWGVGKQPVGSTTDSVNTVSHGGGINGFNTLIVRIPADKNLIVLLNNTGGAALNEMSTAILGILYGGTYEMPHKSLANSLFEVINEVNIATGLDHFEKLKKEEAYALREGEMNNAGYRFLQMGKVKEAIAVFKLNVASFPDSGNVYDSLGEAYLKDGNNKLAAKNYKKAVELDPENSNAIAILKDIQSKK